MSYSTTYHEEQSIFIFKSIVTSKPKQRIMQIDDYILIFTSRKGDLDSFFSHENQSYPASISKYGKLRTCIAKPDFWKGLDMLTEPHFHSPNVYMKVVDEPGFVNMNLPKSSRTFGDYCEELKQKASNIAYDVQCLDLVFDIYLPNSLKTQTRDKEAKQ